MILRGLIPPPNTCAIFHVYAGGHGCHVRHFLYSLMVTGMGWSEAQLSLFGGNPHLSFRCHFCPWSGGAGEVDTKGL